jgi:hypothetical protein
VPLVHLEAVRLTDAIDELHLQRNDRHRRERLRQQLDRTVHDRVIQDVLVHFGIRHRASGGNRRTRCKRRSCDGICLTHDFRGFPRIEPQRVSQFEQELLLGGTRDTVRIADADGHLVRQLLVCGISERRCCLREVDALEQHILVERAQLRTAALARERVGDAADLLALALVFCAIGECGE